MTKPTTMTIAIDFDGCIVADRWPEIGEPLPNAILAINALHTDGHRLILNTCRKGEHLKAAVEFLKAHRIRGLFDCINKNLPSRIEKFGGDCRKISADIYIDDRNLGGMWPWLDIVRMVRVQAMSAKGAKIDA